MESPSQILIKLRKELEEPTIRLLTISCIDRMIACLKHGKDVSHVI